MSSSGRGRGRIQSPRVDACYVYSLSFDLDVRLGRGVSCCFVIGGDDAEADVVMDRDLGLHPAQPARQYVRFPTPS